MAQVTTCNDCGFRVYNYSETAQADWDNHPCSTGDTLSEDEEEEG